MNSVQVFEGDGIERDKDLSILYETIASCFEQVSMGCVWGLTWPKHKIRFLDKLGPGFREEFLSNSSNILAVKNEIEQLMLCQAEPKSTFSGEQSLKTMIQLDNVLNTLLKTLYRLYWAMK